MIAALSQALETAIALSPHTEVDHQASTIHDVRRYITHDICPKALRVIPYLTYPWHHRNSVALSRSLRLHILPASEGAPRSNAVSPRRFFAWRDEAIMEMLIVKAPARHAAGRQRCFSGAAGLSDREEGRDPERTSVPSRAI